MFSRYLVAAIMVILLLPSTGNAGGILAPPFPTRIGGTVTVDGKQLSKANDTGFTFKVTREDGTAFVPKAEDTDGLNSYNWYVIDVPVYRAPDQPGGANQGDIAVIHAYMDGSELTVTSPPKGGFTVGQSGLATRIDLRLITNQPLRGGRD